MNRLMRTWLAASVAIWMSVAGCGGGNTANGAAAPKITSTPPSTATVGVPFNYTVTVEGMTPIVYAVVSGPEGLSIHPANGVVTWTPDAEGSFSVELSATNIAGSDTQTFDVQVEGLTGPVFTTEPPTEATVAAQYAYDPMVVSNGDVTWSAPTAPSGLSIDESTGAVRWTPSSDQAGMQDVTIRATETESGLSSDQAYVVTVVDTGGPAVITSTPPERVYAGEVWTYDATAAGAPIIHWALEAPSSGTPASGVRIATEPPEGAAVTVEWDTSGIAPGDFSIAIRVSNGLGEPNVQELTVRVDPRPPVPEIDLVTVPPPATVFVGTTYNYDVNLTPESESEGVSWRFAGSTNPEDLAATIDPNTGQVSFTASVEDGEIEYSYRVRAENVLGEGDEEMITVDAVFPPATPVLTVTPATDFTLEVGESFPGASAMATGNPAPVLSISGTLPDFLQFDPLTGLLSASTSQAAPENGDIGTHSFDIVATNSVGVDSATIDVTVIAAPPSVDSITPAAGRRQSDVPVVVRGGGFVSAATPVIRLELGGHSETLTTTFVDESTLTATVPIDLSRPSGVYDVVVDQGSTTSLSKRFTVTEGDGSTLSGTIAADRTLTAIDSPHVITGDVRIENGATLTVEPGAVLMLAGNSNRRVDVGVNSAGAMVADGGAPGVGEQVVFTRFQDVNGPAPAGQYRGLRFGANTISSTTVLRNVVLEFGGRQNGDTERGAIETLSGSAPMVHESIVRESLNYGLYAQAGSGSDTSSWFHDNQLTANARSPISIGSDEVSRLGSNLELLGNGEDRVVVRGSAVTRPNAAWANYGVPYFLRDGLLVRNGSVMTLAPGTELRFAANRRLQVASNSQLATLIASGTPEAPIRMVADGLPWRGILFENLIQTGTVLRNVRVEGVDGISGALRVDRGGAPGDRIAIVESCLFQSSEPASVGVYLLNGAGLSSFENNVLDVTGESVNATLTGFHQVLRTSNRYEAALFVRGSSATGADMVWSKPVSSTSTTQPIRPTGDLSVIDGSLSIAAGNQIRMPVSGQITMTGSQLLVEGTASEPVVFEPRAGAEYWNRIRLRGNGGAGASHIAHSVIQSAGSDPGGFGGGNGRAAIVVEAYGGSPATPTISETMIVDSNGYGITFADTTHCAGTCNDNTVVGARFAPLRIYGNYVGRFGTGNALAGNNSSGSFGHDGVWVNGDVIDTTADWPANDVPYLMQGDFELRSATPLDATPILTIEPGAELRFAENRRLRVGEGNDGVLIAEGTSAAPITFTSIDAGNGVSWRGLDFNQGSAGSSLDHLAVSYGGRAYNTGNINFRSGAVVMLGAVSFTHSDNWAAVIFAGSAPMFVGPATDRLYEQNGQLFNPGPGDPTYDCVRDLILNSCEQL